MANSAGISSKSCDLQVADEVNTIDALYVAGTIMDMDISFMVDSGCPETLVSTTFYDSMPKKKRPALSPPFYDLKQADGSPLPNIGSAQMIVQVGRHKVRQTVIFAEIEDEALLGAKFMFTIGGMLNFENRQIITKDDVIQCRASHLPNVARVKVGKTYTIAPGQEVLLPGVIPGKPVYADRNQEASQFGIVEPVAGHALSDTGYLVGHTLVDTSKDVVPVRVFNPGSSERKISKGTTIAVLRKVSAEEVTEKPEQDVTPDGEIVIPEHLTALYQRSTELVPVRQHPEIASLLKDYEDVFSRDENDIGRTDLMKHRINTGNANPIRQPPRRAPITKRDEIDRQVENLLERGLIEESDSPWASPIVLVKKKDGSQRMCVDYRKLNSFTIKDAFPIPRIDDTLDSLAGAAWFSTLDMSSGYWQVEMTEEAAEKSSFVVRDGLYKWKVMPFGLCNAPATFERLMEKVLSGLHWEVALIYLDDVIVFAKTIEEELHRLKIVFDRFRQAGLKLKPKKCELFQSSVLYLGYQVSKDGVSTNLEKIKIVQEWPVPRNVRDVRSFIGLTSYYRKFVKGFADIARPLHKLMSKNAVFKWSDECQKAFEHLKMCLVTAPVLAYPEAKGTFYLDTDASGTGIGGVLAQEQNQQEKVIAYASRTLTKEEQNYCVTRRELLAVVHFLKHFRHYLYGRPVVVRTDHGSLRWLTNFKQPEGQLAHWIEMISEYDLTIVHRPGYQHKNADALSRVPCKQCGRLDVLQPVNEQDDSEINASHGSVRTSHNRIKIVPTWTSKDLREAQLKDCTIAPVLRAKEAATQRPEWQDISEHSLATKCYWGQWEQLQVKDGVLCKRWESHDGTLTTWLVLVPQELRSTVLREMHGGQASGHLGVNRTLGKLRTQYTWYGMSADTRSWIRECDKCAVRKSPSKKSRGELQQPKVGAPMELVALDILGPLPITERGNRYVLVIGDYHTKWLEAFPLPNQEAKTVARCFVEQFACRFGMPDQLHSDQGRQFESAIFGEMCKLFHIYKSRTTPYNPKSDGMVERFNRTLLNIVATQIAPNRRQRDWDEQLPFATFAYRSTHHASTGETPHMMMLGREVRTPTDWIVASPAEDTPEECNTDYVYELRQRLAEAQERARVQLQQSARRQKNLYDRKISGNSIKTGDFVWLQNPTRTKGLSPKLQAKWTGPYLVITRLSDLVYRIQRQGPQGKMQVVHYDRLKLYAGIPLRSWLDKITLPQPHVTEPVLVSPVELRTGNAGVRDEQDPDIGQPSSELDSAYEKRLTLKQPAKVQLSADKPKQQSLSTADQPTCVKPTQSTCDQPNQTSTCDQPNQPTRDRSSQSTNHNVDEPQVQTKKTSPKRYPRRENKQKPARYR
jgi:hypothetical protein